MHPRQAAIEVAEDSSRAAPERIAAWSQCWDWLLLTCQFDRLLQLADQIKALAEEIGDLKAAIEADVVAADAVSLAPGPKAEAIRLSQEAVIDAEGLGFPALAARAQTVNGYALATVGAFHAGIEQLLAAKDSMRERQDEPALAWADLRLARSLYWAEEPGGAARTAERVVVWARKNSNVELESGALAQLAESLCALGRLRDARAAAELALSLAQRHGLTLFEGEALIQLGDLAEAEGYYERALNYYNDALVPFGPFPSLHLRLGAVHYQLGDFGTAREELGRSIELAVAEGYADLEFKARDLLAHMAEADGNFVEALDQVRLARDAERGHRTASFDRRVAETLAGFETERLKREVDSERERREQLEYLALTDPLTDLLNRRGFDVALSQIEPGPFGLIMIDLDRFKLINDAHGHDVGDEVLRRVAHAIVAKTPDRASVTRLGGDEFAVLLPSCDVEAAREIAGDIVEGVAEVELSDLGVSTTIGVSVGCSHRHHGDEDPRELLRAADRALYKAKTEGVSRVCADHL